MPADFDPQAYTPFRTFIYRATARYFFGSIFTLRNRLSVKGRENIPPEAALIVVANHLSNWDPPLIATALDRPVAFLAKKELYSHPIVRRLILFYGAISVDRENPEPSTFKAVKQMLKSGWDLGMFIEGTRSRTPGVLGRPHPGPAYLARINRAPILPVGLIGTNQPGGKFSVTIGKPIPPSNDVQALTWTTMKALSDLTGFTLPPEPENGMSA